MNNSSEPSTIYFGKQMALYSAAIGTLILISFLITKADVLIYIGLLYIFIAAIINIGFIFIMLFECFRYQQYWQKIVTTIILMLFNIPLSLFYCCIALN